MARMPRQPALAPAQLVERIPNAVPCDPEAIKQAMFDLIEKYNATADQLLLAWIMKHPAGIIPVVGTTNPDRLRNSLKAASIELELQDWFEIQVASQGHKVP